MEWQKSTLAHAEKALRKWVVVDVDGEIVGRVATKIALMLRGKDRPDFTPHVDNGNFVVVINASKVRFSGNKWEKKYYHRHSGYPGGLKSISAGDQLQRHPDRILRDAVWGMLPKNTLSRHLMRKLKIYPGAGHPHAAQLGESKA